MTSIISLNAEREKRDGPDPAHVCVDERGMKWFEFFCEYRDGDKRYGFRIWATSLEDAERRLALIGANGKVDGQLYAEIPE